MQTHTVHIQAEDVDGHKTDDFTHVIESTFSKYAGPVIDFLQFGVNWITDKVGDFLTWIGSTVVEALNAALQWVKDKAMKVLNYMKSRVSEVTEIISSGFSSLMKQFIIGFINFQPGSLQSISDTIMANDPLIISIQPALDFLEEYKVEIEWAEMALELFLTASSPVGIASFALSALGPSLGVSANDLIPVLDLSTGNQAYGESVGSAIAGIFSIIGLEFDALVDFEFPLITVGDLDLVFNELDSIVDPFMASMVNGMYLSFKNSIQTSSLQLNEVTIDPRMWVFGMSITLLGATIFAGLIREINTQIQSWGLILDIIGFSLIALSQLFPYDKAYQWDLISAELIIGLIALELQYYQMVNANPATMINLVATIGAFIEIILTGLSATLIE